MAGSICICMFTYNNEKYVAEAIESLLAQTYKDFRLIIVDDCSTDNTEKIVLDYVYRDERISFFKNEKRIGLAANYRRTFELADDVVEYMAWAAGHDVHHPRWLEAMVQVLNEYPDVVMAYPLAKRISGTGEDLNIPSPVFETFGFSVKERIEALYSKGTGFGNMIYGLFRAEVLHKAGVFPQNLVPDVLLLWQISLYGSFKQVPNELWYRRFVGLFSIERQKRTVFVRVPWYAHIHWYIANSVVLAWNTVISPHAGGFLQRLWGGRLTLMFFVKYAGKYYRKSCHAAVNKYITFAEHSARWGDYLIIPYRIGRFVKRKLTGGS